MSLPLFRAMLKTHGQTMLGFAVGSFFYIWLIIWIYPTISTKGMNELLQAMPESVLKMFGLEAGIQKLNEFIAGEYYGFLYLIIFMVFSVLTPTQIVVRLVDRGSMVYLLTTSVSRTRLIITQACYLLFGLFMIALFTTLGGYLGDRWLIEKPSLNEHLFIQTNLVGFLLFSVVSGYSFFFSCLLDDEKQALSASAALTLLFFSMDLIGKMSDKLEWLRHFTVFSTFEPAKIAHGTVEVWLIYLGLGGATILLYGLAVLVFNKKDLPI